MNNDEVKVWWQSKIIWAQVVAFVFAIATMFNFDLPTVVGLSEADLLAAIMVIVGVVTSALRFFGGPNPELTATKAQADTKMGLLSRRR